jgi:hypothetical protein
VGVNKQNDATSVFDRFGRDTQPIVIEIDSIDILRCNNIRSKRNITLNGCFAKGESCGETRRITAAYCFSLFDMRMSGGQ